MSDIFNKCEKMHENEIPRSDSVSTNRSHTSNFLKLQIQPNQDVFIDNSQKINQLPVQTFY